MNHRLELAIKDAIQNDMEEVETALRDLYYIYQNSGKQLRELRSLPEILKELYSFENKKVKPSKSSGTRWIDHKLRAMKAFVDKRGLYLAHIQNVIADTSKQNDKATLEGKRRRIAKASVLLKSAMYADILEPARLLSLVNQKTSEVDIVKQVDAVDKTLKKYEIMERRAEESDATATSVLPTVKHMLSVIEEEGLSVSQEHQYQGIAVTHLQQSKDVVNSLVHRNFVTIYQSLARRFGSFMHEEGESSKETKDADEVAHSVAKLFNTRVWMQDVTEDKLLVQMQAISNVFESFKDVDPLCQISIELLQELYVMLVQWATAYLNVAVIDSMDLWPRLWKIKLEDAQELWVLIELCFCCPYGNAVCESLISYLRVVKTDWRNRLNERNLIDLMRIKVTGPTLPVFRECFGKLAVNNDKARRTTQRKRKQYAARGNASKRTRETESEEFLRDWLKDVGVEGEKESEGEENDEEMEANVLEEDEPEPSQEIPPVQSHHLSDSCSDSSGDSDREDPLLGGMISSDSVSE